MRQNLAAEAASQYPTLELQGGRSALAALVRSVRHLLRPAPCAGAINALADMIDATRPSDWTSPDTEPCCYMDAAELAIARAIPASTWRRYEVELAASGLIERRTAGNGARSRWKGTGIYFGPLMAQINHFLALKAQADAERREHAHMRGARSMARRHLRLAIEALAELGAPIERIAYYSSERDSWPSAEQLHRMSLPELAAHLSSAQSLMREADMEVENLEKSSGPPPNFDRSHIQVTTQDNNMSGNASVDNRRAADAAQDEFVAAAPNGASDCREKKYGQARGARNGQFMDRLGPERLYHLASEHMRCQLMANGKAPAELTLYDFICAAYDRLPSLGVRTKWWDEWAQIMPEEEIMLCVLITDAKRSDPHTPVISPGGYLQGMIRAHEQGKLNLSGSLIGLNERRRDEEERP